MPPKFQSAGSSVAAGILTVAWLHVTATPMFAHGDFHERIQALTQQLQTNAGNADLWLQRADLNRQHSDYILATADASEAARLRPDWPAPALERARIQFDTGAPAAAAAAATACLQLDAANPDALILRARCRAQLGQLAGAVTDFNRALAPTNGPRPLPDLYLERARAQAALGRLAEAARGLDEGIARLGETPSLALPALEYDRARGDFAGALARVERARKFFPPENFRALRGEVLLQAGRQTEAERDFQTGLTALEHYPPARRELLLARQLEARLRAGLRQAAAPPEPIRTSNAN